MSKNPLHILFFAGVVCASTLAHAAATPTLTAGTWNAVTSSTTAVGSVDGININATTNVDAPFTLLATHRFANNNIVCGGWDAGILELDPDALALTTTYVNGGDYQQFDFDAPWSNGYFYIENFDSNSQATITLTGGATAELVAYSASISYAAAGSSGVLTSSNPLFNGEGDAVLKLNGDVTSIRVDYSQGDQANGVFYGFASGTPGAGVVPEPASILIWGSLFGLIVTLKRRFEA